LVIVYLILICYSYHMWSFSLLIILFSIYHVPSEVGSCAEKSSAQQSVYRWIHGSKK